MKRKDNELTLGLITLISGFYLLNMLVPQIDVSAWLSLFQKAVYGPGDTTFHGVYTGEIWRLLTVGLVHASLIHLLSNLFFLWVVGVELEKLVGKTKFVIVFLFSQLTASLASLFFAPTKYQVSVGVSGALFGLFAAIIVFGRKGGVDRQAIIGTVIINIVITFAVPSIDWRAHLGGALGGAAIAYLIEKMGPNFKSRKKGKKGPDFPPLLWD